MSEKYVLQKITSSFCPRCGKSVYLLCPEFVGQEPQFYICFDCEFVAQIGVGIIKEEVIIS